MDTKRLIFLCYLIKTSKIKTSKITPKGKFTAKCKNFCMFVTCCHRRILIANCCAWQLIFYCPRAQWVALWEQICAVAPIISRFGAWIKINFLKVTFLTSRTILWTYLKIFRNCDIFEECGESGIKIDVKNCQSMTAVRRSILTLGMLRFATCACTCMP